MVFGENEYRFRLFREFVTETINVVFLTDKSNCKTGDDAVTGISDDVPFVSILYSSLLAAVGNANETHQSVMKKINVNHSSYEDERL